MIFSAFDEVKDKLIYFNELAQKILGLSNQELSQFSGEELRNLVHPEDIQHAVKAYRIKRKKLLDEMG